MITTACQDTKLFVEKNNDSINNNILLQNSDRNQFSGFETVLFNKQLTNLIHCPITAKGEYIIPLNVETIGIEAFSQCREITSILIPEGIKKIGCMAFENCTGLTTVIIPGSVEEIEFRGFSDCTGLRSIYILTKSIPVLRKDSQVFHNINKKNCILYVLKGTKRKYIKASQWNEFQKILEIDSL